MTKYAKIYTKHINRKHCEVYCVLPKHTIKFSINNMQMREIPCSNYNDMSYELMALNKR